MIRDTWGWGRWGPFGGVGIGIGRQSRFFEFGEVRLAILSLLSDGPKHGYQLMKEMTERSGGLYHASAGSIYPTLQQLEDEGLIVSQRQEGKKVYTLTEAGSKELDRDPEAVHRIWRRAQKWEDWGQYMSPQIMVLAGPVAGLMKAAFRALKIAAGDSEREAEIRDILDRATREVEDLERTWGK